MGKPGDYSIGSMHWPGLSKLIEEMGEVQQVVGKLLGTGGAVEHWDGQGDLRTRLEDELADLEAAITLVRFLNSLDTERMRARVEEKLDLFIRWHGEQGGTVVEVPRG